MAVKTYTQQLEAVQTIIEEVEMYGQSNRGPDGTMLMRGDLDSLYRREERLRPLAARESIAADSSRRGKRKITYVVPTNG